MVRQKINNPGIDPGRGIWKHIKILEQGISSRNDVKVGDENLYQIQ